MKLPVVLLLVASMLAGCVSEIGTDTTSTAVTTTASATTAAASATTAKSGATITTARATTTTARATTTTARATTTTARPTTTTTRPATTTTTATTTATVAPSTTTTTPVGGVTVTIATGNFVFSPASVTINVGDTVQWTLRDGSHTSTSGTAPAPDGGWDQVISAEAPVSIPFDQAGEFRYFCRFHPDSMQGTVVVQP